MMGRLLRLKPAQITVLMGAGSLVLCAALLAKSLPEAASSNLGTYNPERMVLIYATLPRLAMALVCGGALAVAGAILQQVLRNPLASPTTLGVDAGARLALALSGAYFPAVMGGGRDLVALAGSGGAFALVLAISRGRAFSAINIILAGLVVSLYCGALSVVLTLTKDRYLVGLFVWGSGSLSQIGWDPVRDLTLRVGLTVLPLAWLWRPLEILEIGDAASQGVGVPVARLRLMAIAIALSIAAFVTASVGVIGFIGLCAPLIARLSGARRFRQRLVWSAVLGALLLLGTDAVLQLASPPSAALLPTGAVTALLGAPLLLALLPKLRFLAPPPSASSLVRRRAFLSRQTLMFSALLLGGLLLLSLLLGRGANGEWMLLAWGELDAVIPWRLPRWGAVCGAGAMLSVAGFILQRLTGNPMASPEILGVSAGAMLAVALALFLFGATGSAFHYLTGTLGGLAALALILLLSRRAGFSPERVLLAGIGLTSLIDAFVGILTATGDPNAVLLLNWLAGSANGAVMADALYSATAAVVLTLPAVLMARWLAILPLGAATAAALGVPVAPARLVLFGIAALLTAAATPIIGPLAFVGLMAPAIVSAVGIYRPVATVGACALTGAALMSVADLAARTLAYPILLPTGVTAALIAGPLLLFLIRRSMSRV